MSKKKDNIPSYIENISIEQMDNVMDTRSAIYAKEVIQDRAIPDLRDGLKPVQRRIVYSMYKSNNIYEHPTRKCAKIVGDVMGNYHPHGDSSIYEALVRMSQPWKMSLPIIKFQGNNGGLDNDAAASSRYTEAKLGAIYPQIIGDIDEETVDMVLNYDDTLFEPKVLPIKFPNLFVNGSSGIAFAIATEIPPHNLNEMCEAAIHRLNHPSCTLEDILEIVKGPDFPTYGNIPLSDGLKDIYRTGKGKIEISSTVNIETDNKEYNKLVISDIPYGVVKKDLYYSIDKIKKDKEINGIIEVLDESSGDGVRLTVSLKKEVNPETVLNYLYSKTQLRISYNANIVAIDKNTPKILPIIDYLDTFNAFQTELVLRKSQFELGKAKERLHIVEGLIKAISIVNEVIKVIKNSKDKQDSKVNLINQFGFSDPQAEAIVMMRLYRLSNTDVTTYINEKTDLEAKIKDLEETISTPLKVKHIIVDSLKDIIKKYGYERRTKIVESVEKVTIEKRDLIVKEDCYVTITKDGYINRSSIKSHDASIPDIPKTKENDVIKMCCLCNTMDYILAFTNKGNYIFIPVYDIEEGKYKDQGKHINYICTLPIDESIIKVIIVKNFDVKVSIGLISKKGHIKKTTLKEFFAQRYSRPIVAMKLQKDDELMDVFILNGNSNILITTAIGNFTYFNENEFVPTGLKTNGVKAISTLKNSYIKSAISFASDEKNKVMYITDNKMQRIFDSGYCELTQRLGKTQSAFKSFKSDLHNLAYSEKLINKDENRELYILMDNKEVIKYKILDYYLTPVEKYCKENMELKSKAKIVDIFTFDVPVIDKNYKTEKSRFIQTNIPFEKEIFVENNDSDAEEKESKPTYEQISIFDDMGD